MSEQMINAQLRDGVVVTLILNYILLYKIEKFDLTIWLLQLHLG